MALGYAATHGGTCSLPPWAAAVGIFFKKIELLKD
jgi:hypothetical protein